MTIRSWLPSFAPLTMITIAAVFATTLAVAAIVLALNGPWLGLSFDRTYEGEGVRVEKVIDSGPCAGKLQAGDIIRAFVTASFGRVDILPFVSLENPDQLPSYTAYNSFLEHQQAVSLTLSASTFTAILSDGRHVELTSEAFPGPATLPATFWWLLFIGGTSFFIGVSVWSLRPGDAISRVQGISSMGFMLGTYSSAIYITREFVLPSRLFSALVSVNHLGLMVLAYIGILFFWYYPKKLGNGPVARILVVWLTAVWVNETLQVWSWPTHTFYAHVVVVYSLLISFTMLQWRQFQGAPLERAMLKWLFAMILLSLSFNAALFYVPIFFTGKPVFPIEFTFSAIFVLYLSLVIGIVRYRQFDMQHWLLTAWQWLIFILLAMIADSLFVYFLHLNNTTSVALSIAVGSVYLLLRQWFWRKYSGKSDRALDRALPHLIETLLHQQHKITAEQQWQQLIQRVFNPLTIKTIPDTRCSAMIERGGMILQLPSLDGLGTVEAFCCNWGKRLFVSTDLNLANRLLELMRHSRDMIAAREQGAQDERHRIQRDLHDDVAARLLSLLHQTHEPMISKVARNALRGLRDVIHLLGAEEALLEDVITDIEANAREQLAGLEVHLEWRSPDKLPALMLSSQQQINLQRIAREAIANALKHAHPQYIMISIDFDSNGLAMRICNDGAIGEISAWTLGRGVNNIKYRVAEMGGSHKWGIDQDGVNSQYCYLAVRIPLSINEQH